MDVLGLVPETAPPDGPLTGAIVVDAESPFLRQLVKEWAARDDLGGDHDPDYRMDTVLSLQEALHKRESSKLQQPVTLSFNFSVPATGPQPVMRGENPYPTGPQPVIGGQDAGNDPVPVG